MYDIIIVGAGPSGLTAAIYIRRAGKKVLVLEAKSYGGQIINTLDIENYPGYLHISGIDLATNLKNQVIELGAEIKYEEVIDIKNGPIKRVITNNHEYQCQALILATGCDNRKLGLEKEDFFLGRGLSYCATCDGNFYKNKIVAVVGGGNTAVEDALYLSSVAKKVYLIHRRNSYKADEKIVSLLKSKTNVTLLCDAIVTKLNGHEKLAGVEITFNNGLKKNYEVDGLFVAIGRIPMNEKFKHLVKLDNEGYIISSKNCHTNRKGIFVAGDNRRKELRQLVTATSDGAISAVEAVKYLNNK